MTLSAADIRELQDIRRSLSLFQAEWELLKFAIALKAYNPNQPRVPAGNGEESGRWTREGGGWTQIASNTRRPRGTVGGRTVSDAQQMLLSATSAQARAAIARVRERDPHWKPGESIFGTAEGEIAANEAIIRQAEMRLRELQRAGIGPGEFAGESIPARGPSRNFTEWERREIDRIGRETGCHTCGTFDPGTPSNRFVCDHQPPNALNFFNGPQRLFPQCYSCSNMQGGWVRSLLRAR